MISCCITSWKPTIPFLTDTLDSACAAFRNKNVYLHLDKDSEGSEVNSFIRKKYNVNFIEHEKHLSVTEGMNFAISKAETEWVGWIADDDYYNVENCQILLSQLAKGDVDCDIIYSPYYIVKNSGHVNPVGSWKPTGLFCPPENFNIWDLARVNFIGSASFFRKKVWEKLGGLRDYSFNDWDFWVRAKAAGFKFGHTPLPLFYYRQVQGSSMHRQLKQRPFSEFQKEIVDYVLALQTQGVVT